MTFREIRERARISRTILAEQLGLDYTTINKIELGKTPDPRYSTVLALAVALNTTTEYMAEAILNSAKARNRGKAC